MFEDYPDVLTVSDIQRALAIGRNTAYKLIKDNKIKSIRIGKNLRIPKIYLIEFIRKYCYNNIDINERILSQ